MSGLPHLRRSELERNLSLELTLADHEAAEGFLHFCDEWDGLLIDRADPEFEFCSCLFSDDFDKDTGKLTSAAILRWEGKR